VIFDRKPAKRALDEVCAAAGVDILLPLSSSPRIGKTTLSHGFTSPTIRRTPIGRQKRSSTPAATATSASSLVLRRDYGNNGAVNLGTLGPGSAHCARGGMCPQRRSRRRSKKQRPAASGRSARTEASIARLPLSGDVVAILQRDYDPRTSAVFARRDLWARAGLDNSGDSAALPGWEHAYLASTGPEFGHAAKRQYQPASSS